VGRQALRTETIACVFEASVKTVSAKIRRSRRKNDGFEHDSGGAVATNYHWYGVLNLRNTM
jgi:hypothetical protein